MGTNIRTEEFKKSIEHKSEDKEGHEDTISRKKFGGENRGAVLKKWENVGKKDSSLRKMKIHK